MRPGATSCGTGKVQVATSGVNDVDVAKQGSTSKHPPVPASAAPNGGMFEGGTVDVMHVPRLHV